MLSNLSGFSILNPKKRRAFQEITGTFSVPEISFSSATTSSVVTTITNYDAAFTYAVSSSAGTASRSGATVTVSGLSANSATTVTVNATGSGGIQFSTTSASFLSLPATPTLSRSGGTTTTVTVAIGNYNAGLTYTIGSTVGSATRSGSTITVTGLTQGQAVTVTATASNASGNSAQGSLATGAVPATPTLSFSSSTETTATFSITNYNAAYTYSVSSSPGSASRSGSIITVTGLAENTSVTAFATATANGVSSAQGSASGTTLLGSDFESIATVTVGSGGAANIEFTNIPSTYQHLQIRLIMKTTATSGVYQSARMILNGDTGTNYAGHEMYGSGSNTVSSSYAPNYPYFNWGIVIDSDASRANMFAVGVIDILDYTSSTKNTTLRFFSGMETNGFGRVVMASGAYLSTNSISSIRLYNQVNNFAQHTTVALYGVKAP